MALTTRDQNGVTSDLQSSAVAVGLGVTQTGKEFEVAGNIVSRASSDAGGTAIGIATEGDVHGSIWTNRAYDPARPGSGWKRTINLVNGNVGIGGSNDALARLPTERLVVAGNIVATGDVQLVGADCAEEFDVDRRQRWEPFWSSATRSACTRASKPMIEGLPVSSLAPPCVNPASSWAGGPHRAIACRSR